MNYRYLLEYFVALLNSVRVDFLTPYSSVIFEIDRITRPKPPSFRRDLLDFNRFSLSLAVYLKPSAIVVRRRLA